MSALADWIAGLSRRERGLIAVLVLAVLPAAAWFGAAAPLLERRAAARAALEAAEAERAWLAARLAEAAALPDPAAGPAPEGLAGLEARLAAAGLDGARLADAGEGAVWLVLERAPFGVLMAWIEAVEAGAGYRLAGLELTATGEPGQVAAEVRLVPAR